MVPGADEGLLGSGNTQVTLGRDEIEALCTLYPSPLRKTQILRWLPSASAVAIALLWLALRRSRRAPRA
jgi:hypothetical protein